MPTEPAPVVARARVLPYALTIFLSAFLLFQVQLLLAKYILPWYGGVSAVWTTCMLFFQALLLAGYAYAHHATRYALTTQRWLHALLLIVSAALLYGLALTWGAPLLPDGGWKPEPDAAPTLSILLLLAVSVGLPFFMLSATNPLLQSWFSRSHPGVSPYRLFALSNLGSLLGLLSYPFAVEVYLPLKLQASTWAGGYALFGLGILGVILSLRDRKRAPSGSTGAAAPPSAGLIALWIALAACASTLLLATTNQITQDIAAVPLLWMLPLVLYLLSFILCFESDHWYARRFYLPALVTALAASALLLEHSQNISIVSQIMLYSLTLFITCMVCHGELARLKPDARRLTSFYLAVSLGGVLGGVFVGVLAPYVFRDFWEFPIGLWACAALTVAVLWADRQSLIRTSATYLPAAVALAGALLTAVIVLGDRWAGGNAVADWIGWQPDGIWVYLAAGGGVILLTAGLFGGWLKRSSPAGGARFGGVSGAVPTFAPGRAALNTGITLAALLVYGAILANIAEDAGEHTLRAERNFYGLLKVIEIDADDPEKHAWKLQHGRITHGIQYRSDGRELERNAYYGASSGIGMVFDHLPKRMRGEALRVGVIGLGVGTLAAYGNPGDSWRFYDINPAVVRLARGDRAMFSYLSDSPADIAIVLGDARLSLESEPPGGFDILAVDAFSSDSIPVHLLTREAIEVYFGHLAADGILAIHISNRYIGLRPVIARLAEAFGLNFALIDSTGKTGEGEYSSDWALLSRDDWILTELALTEVADKTTHGPRVPLWTDDYSNIFQVVRINAPQDSTLSLGGCLVIDCPEEEK